MDTPRYSSLKRIQPPAQYDPAFLSRFQDNLAETLQPLLANPLFAAADFRWIEVAGAQGATPTLALQYRIATPTPQTWQTILTVPVSGILVPAQGSGSGGTLNIVTKSASYSAASGETVFVTALSSDVLITLPSPVKNAFVSVADVVGLAGGGILGNGAHLSVNVAGGASINNVPQILFLRDGGAATFASDGTKWYTTQGEDQVAPDPRGLSGLQFWADAGRGWTINTGAGPTFRLVALADQSGNGNNLTGAVDWDNGGPTGRPRMFFDGSQWLVTPSSMTPSAGTVTLIAIGGSSVLGTNAFSTMIAQNANSTGATGFAGFVNVNPAAGVRGFVSASGSGVGVNGTNGAGSGTGLANANVETLLNSHCWNITINGTTPYARVDGLTTTQAGSTTAQSFTPTSGNLWIGQSNFNGSNADFWRGTLSEVLMYSPSISAANAFIVAEYYAMKKYGLRL